MGRRLVPVLVALLVGAAFAAPARADDVADAQSRVEHAEQKLSELRAEYAMLAEQAHRAEGTLDQAHLRVVNLARAVEDAENVVATARRAVALRARRAYMGGDPLKSVDALLKVRDYAQIDAYLPYITRPLEEDRRTVVVYRHKVETLRGITGDLDAAKGDAAKRAADLGALEAQLTANLNSQQEELAAARRQLRDAEAARDAKPAPASPEFGADTILVQVPPPGASVVLDGPQRGSGPGPGAGVEVINVPAAPRELPNGVLLGPVAGIPDGMVATDVRLSGVASWYGPGFHGFETASGETYDQYGFTAAHKDLPFGTILLVTFQDRQVLVKVNDRGPYVDDRFLDLSKGAADALGLSGIAYVDAEILVPA